MKNKLEQELKQKEFENEIDKDLNLEYSKLDAHEKLHQGKNKYVITAIYFFGTLFVFYFFYIMIVFFIKILFGAAIGFLGTNMAIFTIPIHAAIFIIATISAVRRRSVLDNIIDRFI